ncbi:sensor domain-containing diguanylate cyclase [Vibrio methylphosphonaticus]|uniref:sensor domain-containing diguanylate cyclase n=1 Tax=Vibrio methylphosphonaticus TaxID=2946866 RepID=UPI00202A103C|nr:diguanylate cyclase [Vibrio methylphosphonaticus]MCL9776910.1 diguanylate cyclase [Vibrio methylphosphonaticus]
MSLAKFLLRVFRPFTFGLIATLIFISYQQYQRSQDLAMEQSQSNVKMASALVWAQIEATFGKVDLLQNNVDTSQFNTLANDVLSNTYLYKNIVRFNSVENDYLPINGVPLSPVITTAIQWHEYKASSNVYAISNIYQKANGFWVFAIKQANIKNQREVWIEFDVQHTTQYLANLKTLKTGYVFVIDAETGRLVFHPDPLRIGSPSISFSSGLQERIKGGEKRGKYEYYYNGQYKMSIFDAQNPSGWVFVSGTNRADILFNSYQISLTAVVMLSLLLLILSINYITFQLNKSLAKLNASPDISHFKHELKSIFNQFTFHKGMQLCLYDNESGNVKTIDFHGNTQIIHHTETLPSVLTRRELNYSYNSDSDAIARKLQIKGRHYTMPLYQRETLIGVIYLKSSFFAFEGVMRAIRDFSEVALSNLLLFQALHSKDPLTGLDNKQAMRHALSQQLRNQNVFYALIDINGLGNMNAQHGDMLGDTIILYIADTIKRNFKKPSAICISRDENGGFAVLFEAENKEGASKQLDWLRQLIEKQPINMHDKWIEASVTIGATVIGDTPDAVIGRAKQSLQQAKLKGRNIVCFYQ